MSKDSHASAGLVPSGKSPLPPAPAGGAVVDMQDLMPVIQSFQDHLATEQARQRDRIRTLVTLFVLALAGAVAYPLWVVKGLFRDQREAMQVQQSIQSQSAESLQQALREVAASSRALREELGRLREAPSAPASAPIVVTTVVAAAVAPVPVPEIAPPPPALTSAPPERVAPPPASVTPADPPVPAPAVTAVVAAPPATSNAVPSAVSNASLPAVQSDLEKLLRQVEESIAEKQNQLKKKAP